MSTDRRIIKRSRIGSGLPLQTTACGWLLLDRFEVHGWGLGVFWTLVAILWVAAVILLVFEEEVDPLPPVSRG